MFSYTWATRAAISTSKENSLFASMSECTLCVLQQTIPLPHAVPWCWERALLVVSGPYIVPTIMSKVIDAYQGYNEMELKEAGNGFFFAGQTISESPRACSCYELVDAWARLEPPSEDEASIL